MIRETIKRHYKIISSLQKRPMSFSELHQEMLLEEELFSEKLATSQRTFQRDISDIESIYGICIENNRGDNTYAIVESTESKHSERLRENVDLLNAIRLTKNFRNNFMFEERRALGTHHLAGLLHAVQEHLEVKFSYHKYYDDSDSQRQVQPYALKEARNRWYLIARDGDSVKNFGIDRISELQITQRSFTPPRKYDLEEEFRHSFGIINGTGEEPQRVLLSFTPREGRYIKSLPLHHSQQLVHEDEKEIRFSLYLRPTYDFRMELLSFGDQVEVLEPQGLRQAIREQLEKSLKRYL